MDEIEDLNKSFERISNFQHITYKDKIQRAYNELINTDPDKIIKRGWDEWDNVFGGIYGGKIYLIGADTGVGKTTFINQVLNNIQATGESVVRYSLEDRLEDIGKEELFYEVNRLRKSDFKQFYIWTKFVNHEYKDSEFMGYLNKAFENMATRNIIELEKRKKVGIDDLIILMEEECEKGVKVFAIDHLHYFEWDKTSKERIDIQIENVMHRLNELARKNNVAIFLVAHYRKRNSIEKNSRPSYDYFKDGSAIKQVANIIIQIERDIEDENNKSIFYITKIRGPIKAVDLETEFDLSTFTYQFTKSKRQKEKENENLLKLMKR